MLAAVDHPQVILEVDAEVDGVRRGGGPAGDGLQELFHFHVEVVDLVTLCHPALYLIRIIFGLVVISHPLIRPIKLHTTEPEQYQEKQRLSSLRRGSSCAESRGQAGCPTQGCCLSSQGCCYLSRGHSCQPWSHSDQYDLSDQSSLALTPAAVCSSSHQASP